MTPVIRVCGMSMDESYHGIRIKLLAAMSALGGLRYRRFWFEVVLAASGASNKGV